MSRRYVMTFEVGANLDEDGLSNTAKVMVGDILHEEWQADYIYGSTWAGENYLGGGESEEEFATRISTRIWTELCEYVSVNVIATYLEDLPSECHTLDRDDYDQWRKEVELNEEEE